MKGTQQNSGKDSRRDAPARRGRPVGDRDAKRGELLAAAISVIANEGYSGASMRKVAKKAGCTTGAVTYYFANKEEMIVAVAESLFDEFDSLLNARAETVDIRSMLRDLLDWSSVDRPEPWLALSQLLAYARLEAAFSAIIRRRNAHFREGLTAMLRKGQEQGSIRDDIEADLLAEQVTAISDGWIMALPIEPQRFTGARGKALIDAVMVLISPHKK